MKNFKDHPENGRARSHSSSRRWGLMGSVLMMSLLASLMASLLAGASARAEVIIIDDLDGSPQFTITNDTQPRTNKAGQYADHVFLNFGGETATWTPTLQGGRYGAYVWNPTDDTAIVSATTTVNHKNGSTAYNFKQTDFGGGWYLLGMHDFDAGSGGSVTVTNPSNYGYADAVRFDNLIEYTTETAPDNWTQDGDWSVSTSGGDVISNDLDAEMNWTASDVLAGEYEIGFSYRQLTNRPTNARVQVWSGGTNLSGDITVNQNGGDAFLTKALGTYNITSGDVLIKVFAGGTSTSTGTYTSSDGFNMVYVPEPSSLALLMIAGLGCVLLSRRRRA